MTQIGPNAVEQQIVAITEIEIQRFGVDFSRRFEELLVRGLVHFNHGQTLEVFNRLKCESKRHDYNKKKIRKPCFIHSNLLETFD